MSPFLLLGIVIFISISVLAPLCVFSYKEEKTFFISYYLVLGLHFLIATIQSFIQSFPGTDKDAMRFFHYGGKIADTGIYKDDWYGSHLYDNLVGLLFSTFETSLFLACITSIFAFSLSFIFIYKLLLLIKPPSNKTLLLMSLTLFYAFAPSTLIFTSVSLRESWEILLIAICIYNSFAYINYQSIKYVLFMFPCLLGLVLIHKGLYIYALILPIGLLFPKDFIQASLPPVKNIFFVVFLITFVAFLPRIFYISSSSITPPVARAFSQGRTTSYVEKYRRKQPISRATYGIMLNKKDKESFITSGIMITFSYLFRPFYFEIENYKDIYAFLESSFRFILIITFLYGWLYMTRRQQIISIFIGFHYSILTLLWAFGTTNWGTAIRHHTTHQFLLVILGTMGAIALYDEYRKRNTASLDLID